MNHFLNNDHKNITTGKQELESELRAWRVGLMADTGRPPTNLDTGVRALSILGLAGRASKYSRLQQLFNTDDASRDAMIETLRKIWNHGNLSLAELLASKPKNPNSASMDLGAISENDPNNLNNSTTVQVTPNEEG